MTRREPGRAGRATPECVGAGWTNPAAREAFGRGHSRGGEERHCPKRKEAAPLSGYRPVQPANYDLEVEPQRELDLPLGAESDVLANGRVEHTEGGSGDCGSVRLARLKLVGGRPQP